MEGVQGAVWTLAMISTVFLLVPASWWFLLTLEARGGRLDKYCVAVALLLMHLSMLVGAGQEDNEYKPLSLSDIADYAYNLILVVRTLV